MLKFNKIKILSLTIIFLSIFSFASYAKAQTVEDIEATLSPEYPKAGESVSIRLQNSATDLNQATISWIIGGKVQIKGLGMTDFITTAGKIGSVTTVTARVVTSNKVTLDKIIKIQPVDIDLLWQASSYVPPFYQGKALYPHQGLITFTAIPNVSATGNIIKSAGSYIYTWKKDGDVLGTFSGYGKNTFTLRGTIISRPFTMSVDVSSTNGTSLGTASEAIDPKTPQVSLYESDPLLGVLYNRSLSSFVMENKELSIASVPYHFNAGGEPLDLQYKWTMNGQEVSSQNDPSILTVRNTAGSSGKTSIGLQISNTLKILQSASDAMTIIFGNSNNPTTL